MRAFGGLSAEKFSQEENFVQAQFYLRRALEGIFHIGSHVLSRMPGGRATEYKEIAAKLGELGIVDKQFASAQLTRMAGYRNRLTHFYAEITPGELHGVLRNHLDDVDQFLHAIRAVLEYPERYHLTIE